MGKHRNKHKKSKADYQPSQKSPGIPLMNSEKPDANDHATTNAKKQTAKSNTPSSWNQVVEWAKEGKTFTDWCVAVFTFVLAAAAIYQFTVMNGQLDTMRKDQRPWIDFTFASNTNALQVDSDHNDGAYGQRRENTSQICHGRYSDKNGKERGRTKTRLSFAAPSL